MGARNNVKDLEDLDKVIRALAHPIRRRVIEELAKEGSLSYKELMDRVGISDSGTFGFHLRNLKGLVEKNERGEYQLTQLGWKAYDVLKILKGKVEEVKKKEKEWAKKVISDRISFTITKSLLEKLKESRTKLYISNIVRVIIESDVPRELFDEIVEGIEDVVVIYAPRDLIDIIELKSHDIGAISTLDKLKQKEKHPFEEELSRVISGKVGGLISIITSTVSSIVPSIVSAILPPELHKEMEILHSGKIDIDDSKRLIFHGKAGGFNIILSSKVKEPKITIWRSGKSLRECSWNYEVKRIDNVKTLIVRGNACKMQLELPINTLKEVEVNVEAGSLKLHGEGDINLINISVTAGSSLIELKDIGTCKIHARSKAGSLKGRIDFGEFQGESIIDLESVAGSTNIKITVPINTSIYAKHEFNYSCAGIIEVDGEKHIHYKDPNYEKAKSKLKVMTSCSAGAVKASITRIKH